MFEKITMIWWWTPLVSYPEYFAVHCNSSTQIHQVSCEAECPILHLRISILQLLQGNQTCMENSASGVHPTFDCVEPHPELWSPFSIRLKEASIITNLLSLFPLTKYKQIQNLYHRIYTFFSQRDAWEGTLSNSKFKMQLQKGLKENIFHLNSY